MTLLAEDAKLWDAVFRESPRRVRFVKDLVGRAGTNVLDVGCATGSLCGILRRGGARAVGLDINAHFVAAAKAKHPDGEYHIGNMKNFHLQRRFDLLICLGTAFSYTLTNQAVEKTLANFRTHLRPGGLVVIDVLNAMAFMGPRPFETRTEHKFKRNEFRAAASIRHKLNLQAQTMTEQVTWKIKGRRVRRDARETLRLFFPQELSFHLQVAGFRGVRLMDNYGSSSESFGGPRLIAVAAK